MKPKIALVTGGARGLGYEFCRQLAQQNCSVILTARDEVKGNAAAQALQEEDLDVHYRYLDVSREEDIVRLLESVAQDHDHLDLLINNAGVNSKSSGQDQDFRKNFKLTELEPEAVFSMMSINALAPILMAKHFLPLLKQSRNPKIINVSSWLGSISQKTNGGNYSYCGSKALLNMFTRTLAFDVVRDGITAIAVNPGWVQTDMGGGRAKLSPEQSVNGLMEVINKVGIRDTGKFFQWDGTEHPW